MINQNLDLIKSIFFYSLPIIISSIASLVSIPLITKSISVSDYGLLEFIILTIDLVYIILCLEFEQALAIYINEDNKNKSKIFSTCFNINLIFIILFIFLINFINYFFSFVEFNLLIIISIFLFFTCGTKVLKNLLRYTSLTKFYSFISIFISANIFILNIIAFLYGILNLYNILLILAIAHCFGAFVIFFKIDKNLYKKKIYINYFKKFIIFSLPLIPGSILNFLNTFVDRYIISIFLDFNNLGYFSLAFKVCSITSLLFVGISLTISPIIYKNLKNANAVKSFISFFLQIVIIISLLFWIYLSLFSEELVLLLSTSEFIKSSDIIFFLLPSVIIINLWSFFPGIIIKKKTIYILFINLFSLILNIVFSLFLINHFGLKGVAISTSLSAFIAISLNAFISQKYFKLIFKTKTLLIYLFLIVINYYLNFVFDLSLLNKILISIFLFIICIFYILYSGLLKGIKDSLHHLEIKL